MVGVALFGDGTGIYLAPWPKNYRGDISHFLQGHPPLKHILFIAHVLGAKWEDAEHKRQKIYNSWYLLVVTHPKPAAGGKSVMSCYRV